jgi:hypothetical protein
MSDEPLPIRVFNALSNWVIRVFDAFAWLIGKMCKFFMASDKALIEKWEKWDRTGVTATTIGSTSVETALAFSAELIRATIKFRYEFKKDERSGQMMHLFRFNEFDFKQAEKLFCYITLMKGE